MGLLDRRDESDWALPDFDSSFSPRRQSSIIEEDTKQSQADETSVKRVDSTATSSTDSTSKSPSMEHTTPKRTHSSSTAQRTKPSQRRPQTTRRATIPGPRLTTTTTTPRERRRSSAKVFDLYHEDAALQDAVPRIHFCDICLYACEIH